MRIGILETGSVSKKFIGKHGSYGTMFEKLFAAFSEENFFIKIKLFQGEFPKEASQADLWVITGSRFGVYDDIPWLKPLKSFLEKCLEEKVPIFGVCFGHQLLAEILGGKVEKFKDGWGVGVTEYRVNREFKWTSELSKTMKVYSFHQDQVVKTPPHSTVIAFSDFCKNAILAYGEPNRPFAISVQNHPEFTQGFMCDLINLRKELFHPESVLENALESLDTRVNNNLLVKNIICALVEKD